MSLDALKNLCRVAGLELRTSVCDRREKATVWVFRGEHLCFAVRGTLEEIVNHVTKHIPHHAK